MKTFGDLLMFMGKDYKDIEVLGALSTLSYPEREQFLEWAKCANREFWFMHNVHSPYWYIPVAKQVVDRDYVCVYELLEVANNCHKLELSEVFELFELPAHNSLLYKLRGNKVYHLPEQLFVRPDYYAGVLAMQDYANIPRISGALERSEFDEQVTKAFMGRPSILVPAKFMTDVLGLKNFTERDMLLVSWAFTKVHVEDAWITLQHYFNDISTGKLSQITDIREDDIRAIISYTMRTVRIRMALPGYTETTPMTDVKDRVSVRLYRTINKMPFFEDLIDYKTMTIKPNTNSVELTEELCSFCKNNGWPDAKMDWLPGVGAVVALEGRVKNA